ncbi:MAG: glycosyltransferase family 39 protein [Pyrinomonadaceae bacterium]
MSASSKSLWKWTSSPAIVLYLATAKLLLHLLTAGRYGIFRDELYYLACAEHLDWGYVDQPPAIALIAWFVRHVLGTSLLGLRLLPAIVGAALVWLTGKLARDMGGGRFAQALAALATIVVPIYLVIHHWLTMNAFEPLIWMGAAWCVVRAVNTGKGSYWLWFGVIIGVGLQTKYSVIFFAFGIVVGLILTSERRFLKSKWIWLGALAALMIFLPNLLWLVKHDFPFLELMRNIRESGRDVARGPVAFIADQALIMNPILFPLWAGGLLWLFVGEQGVKGEWGKWRKGKRVKANRGADDGPAEVTENYTNDRGRYRILGWAYVVMLVTFIVLKGKNYYLMPAYPMLFAAGGIPFERATARKKQEAGAGGRSESESVHLPSAPASCSWLLYLRYAYVALILLAGTALTPLSVPLLSPETYVSYQKTLGIEPSKTENQDTGPLPQYFADEFGWEDMTRAVAEVYNSLPPDERAQTAIFANSYGQAGAIDFFGPKYGLPKAISNHQNYWLWGPRNYTGAIVIVLGSDGEGDREHFQTVDPVGRTNHPYSRRDEHYEIFLCRGLNQDLKTLWPSIKKWH